MKDAEEAGEEATKAKLAAFAKDAGAEVTLDEMRHFFKELAESKEGELSDVELDMVAGGKSAAGIVNIVASVMSFGGLCAAISLGQLNMRQDCSEAFK